MTEQEIKELALKVLGELVAALGFNAQCTPAEAEAEGTIKFELQMEDAGRIIGKKGQTLEALELLLNRILHKNDENAPWAIIDVDGYTTGHTGAERRTGRGPIDAEDVARLDKLALDAAKEVRHWNR
ncbi:MAG: KH domain-containing protein, partial [Victivallales bacterium]|nr:KH domain-containing protein [Victivallales bacterium]